MLEHAGAVTITDHPMKERTAMATPTVAPSPNGSKVPTPAAPNRVVVLLAGAKVDKLAVLRATLRALQEEERRLTSEVAAYLEAGGLAAIQGDRAVARFETRRIQKIDPQLFIELVGPRAAEAMTVSVTAARRLAGTADLEAISETSEQRALRVELIGGAS